jgi:RimJ/RimL family protein N-acetyltransferase
MKPPLPRETFPRQIDTARLFLRRPQKRKAELYAEQARESCARREPLSHAEARAFAAFMIGHWDRYGFGFLVIDMVSDLANGVPIGHDGLKYVDAWPNHWPDNYDEIELGYSLLPSAPERGYATEAAGAALTAAFAAFDIPCVRAKCNQDNPKSAAVLLRCGMQEQEVAGKSRRFQIVRPA